MLQATSLSKKYGSQWALYNLNLSIPAGEVYSLLGANGAGKSTTLKLFLNFIQPDEGKAEVNEIDVTLSPEKARKQIAYIPEQVSLYPYLNAWENFRFFTRLAGLKYTKTEAENWLIKAGFPDDQIYKVASAFSKGMRQKVAIAIMLAREAPCFLLDEPMSGLDPKSSHDLGELILQLATEGKSVLMATHDLYRAKDCAHHIGIMKAGILEKEVQSAYISHTELNELYMSIMNKN